MHIRRLADRLRQQDWLTLSLELAIVVIGILLAFQLDRAYQYSQNRELEQSYLLRLSEDLRRDSVEIESTIQRTLRRQQQVALLDALVGRPASAASDPEGFVNALEKVTWRSVATISTGTFDELQATGRWIQIQNVSLRNALGEYYSFIEEQRRLGFGEDDQDRFREETLGILTGSHLSAVEDPDNFSLEIGQSDAVRMAEDFASRKAAHVWLGRLAKYQVLMHRLSEDQLTRNSRLLVQIDSMTAAFR